MLIENLASWNGVKVLEKKKKGKWIFCHWGGGEGAVGEDVFPHKHRENVFLKDNERRQTLAYKDAGMTKDGRWDKQMKKKKR